MSRSAGMPLARPEIVREPVSSGAFGIVEKPLSTWERITNVGAVRKFALLVVLAVVWETYARALNNPLLFPTFSAMYVVEAGRAPPHCFLIPIDAKIVTGAVAPASPEPIPIVLLPGFEIRLREWRHPETHVVHWLLERRKSAQPGEADD